MARPDGIGAAVPRSDGIGAAVPRLEDARLLTGHGRFSDDVDLPGQAHAAFLRSPHAHAVLRTVDAAAARAAPGVLAVLLGSDYAADGLAGIAQFANPVDAIEYTRPAFGPPEPFEPPHPPIVQDKIRHVGEIVAVAVAETHDQALDALERIALDYRPLPNGTPVWAECPDDIALSAALGDPAAVREAFAGAAHTITLKLASNRIANAQMEPRAALAAYDVRTGRYALYTGTQGVNRPKAQLAGALGVPPEMVRVLTGDVGGGFGPRNNLYPEFVLAAWAARRCARPVKWSGSRSEGFLSDYQARDLTIEAALAFDDSGRILAIRCDHLGDIGGHAVSFVPLSNGPRLTTSVYEIAAGFAEIRGRFSNSVPTSVFRGAGRPEAMFAIERLIEAAARRLGMDRFEIRRRNLIPADSLPYASPMGPTYDSGAFARSMDMVAELADWAGFETRRHDARARGRLRGIGIANFIEAPVGAPVERARMRIVPQGRIELVLGTQSQGQGHETTFAQVAAELLGVPIQSVDLISGDSDVVSLGGGTHSDRSMRIAGALIVRAARAIIAEGSARAAARLEAAVADIEFADGTFRIAGTDRALGLFELARDGDLAAEEDFVGRIAAFPNGSAVCEVEIDPETGALDVVRYSHVDDVGRPINPMIVAGQAHGGIAMGIGQALCEHAVYEPETGQLLAGSFMDYALCRAGDLPFFAVALNTEAPTAGNKLGVKGGGEGGTTPALAAVVNAVLDALRPLGVADISMPATAEKVWRAIRAARASSPGG